MSLFGKILKTGFDVAMVPVDLVKDVATLGGAVIGKDEPYTVRRAKKLADDTESIGEELEDL